MAELKVTQIRTSDGTVYDVRDEEAQQAIEVLNDFVSNDTHQVYAEYTGMELLIKNEEHAPDELGIGDLLIVRNYAISLDSDNDIAHKPFETLTYKSNQYSVIWLGGGIPQLELGESFLFMCIGNNKLLMISHGNNGRGTDNIELTGSVNMGRRQNTTVGRSSTAFGRNVVASASQAHAEGNSTEATNDHAHAEGYSTKATAQQSHAEGSTTTASGTNSHAEGFRSIASGVNSHAEGEFTNATAQQAHAEGYMTRATGSASHADGVGTVANHNSQHVFGQYNVEDPSSSASTARGNYIEIVGNGAYNSKSNARSLDWDGNERLKGDVYVNCNANSSNGTALGAGYNELRGRRINGSTLENDVTIGTPVNVSGNNYKFVMGGVSNG